jgi:hypothetical protein
LPALAVTAAAARTVQHRVLRHFVRRDLLEDYVARDMLTWQAGGGFSVDASVRIPGHDRAGRERLIRYARIDHCQTTTPYPRTGAEKVL